MIILRRPPVNSSDGRCLWIEDRRIRFVCGILRGVMDGWRERFNLAGECRALKLEWWQCPPVLFMLMGVTTIFAMVATYLVASRYTEEPEIAALIVSFVAALFFLAGNLTVRGFNHVAGANRTKSEFISIISHQLGTPLSIFRMTLGLVEREVGADGGGDAIREHLLTLTDAADRMLRLVRSLLEVGRIDAARLVVKKEPFLLDALTRGVVGEFSRYAAANNIAVALDAGPETFRVDADPERIEMAVQNFLDNAIRYTPGGGTVWIAIAREGRMARWSIADQGMGIPEADQPYVFQKFFRAPGAAPHNVRGSGIGLYIAKAVVEACGGTIGFRSAPDRGSTFWFTLPLADV